MEKPVEPRLAELLACPDCGGILDCAAEELSCRVCFRVFEVRDGIPVLLPRGFDPVHLEKERKLGELMKSGKAAGAGSFTERQWAVSKREFWGFVGEKTKGRGGLAVLNAGCGVDAEFLGLGGGDFLVAFDLMHELLAELRSQRGSRFNVAGAVQSLPFREGSFDCVCCIDLLHHEIGEMERIVRSFHRILKPGGMLFLEDINAWALFQFWKSVLLPKGVHGALRSAWHSIRRSPQEPAPYEFPTSVFKAALLLEQAGFGSVEAVPQEAYPNTSRAGHMIYRSLARSERIRKYHNFHYMLFAEKRL